MPERITCEDLRERFVQCMFDLSISVRESGESIGNSMKSNLESDYPQDCRQWYKFYRICLNERIIDIRARTRGSRLPDFARDEEGKLVIMSSD